MKLVFVELAWVNVYSFIWSVSIDDDDGEIRNIM